MASELPEDMDAYALLSMPTLDQSDAAAQRIVEDLRRRRHAYVTSGKIDKPAKEKAERVKLSQDEKARNTAALLAQLTLPGSL
jgi:hypothetical protein